jgi:hypothetical protein
MDLSTITSEVCNELAASLEARNSETTARSVRTILEALERAGYKITLARVGIEGANVDEFNRTVAAWSPDEKVEPGDINGAQIIQSLLSTGWTIVPPQ